MQARRQTLAADKLTQIRLVTAAVIKSHEPICTDLPIFLHSTFTIQKEKQKLFHTLLSK